mmetsp:Transcript_29611/g.41276  ORF Transcript_29611/g.41276 Transcript_29611/m.41276 type:complete len:80 (+) Transcript_29611:553-792(+)
MPELREIKDVLKSHEFEAVLMSGSGTSIFAIGEPEAEGAFLQSMERLKSEWGVQVFKAQFLNRGEGMDDWYEPMGFEQS